LLTPLPGPFFWVLSIINFYQGPDFPLAPSDDEAQQQADAAALGGVAGGDYDAASATTAARASIQVQDVESEDVEHYSPGTPRNAAPAAVSGLPDPASAAVAAAAAAKKARKDKKAQLRDKVARIKSMVKGEVQETDLVELPFEPPSFLSHVQDMGWGMFSIVQYLVTVLGAIIVIYKELQPYDVR
jgi:hypothetical protein